MIDKDLVAAFDEGIPDLRGNGIVGSRVTQEYARHGTLSA